MILQRIYSSKLYVTSTRKDRIHAAIQDPINAELVQQLSDYLDEDAQALLQQTQNSNNVSDTDNSAAAADVDTTSDKGGGAPARAGGPRGGGAPMSFSGNPLDDFGVDELADNRKVIVYYRSIYCAVSP